jgi:hypothetical protein
MVKKKTTKKKKVPKFKCCGEENHKCGESCECKKDKVEVYVCPRCQSVDVGYAFELKNIFGVIPRMKCKDCGFSGMTFPKWFIDKDKLTKEHKPIDLGKDKKKDKKTKKASFKQEIEERYCPHCEDKVKVKMKDGSVDTFICDNCQFEIKKGKKK